MRKRWTLFLPLIGLLAMTVSVGGASAAVGSDVGAGQSSLSPVAVGLISLLAIAVAWLGFVVARQRGEITNVRLEMAARVAESKRELSAAIDHAKETEQALIKNEHRLADFADSASDWFWETDEDHRFCFFSETAMARLEMKADLAYGKSRWELAEEGDENSEFWTRHRLDIEAHRPIKNFVYPLKIDDGVRRYVRVDGLPVFDDKGRFTGYRGVGRNVTDEVEQQKALRDSKKLYQRLAEGSLQGILIHVDGKPVFVNQAYADIFGYGSADEILALDSHLDVIAPEDKERLAGYRDARLGKGVAPQVYDFIGIRKDGSRVHVRGRASLVEWEGKLGVLVTVIDLSGEHHSA